MGMVELPKDATIKLELSIDKEPMVLIEAELVEQIEKYLYSSHKRGDFDSLIRSSDFV